MILAASLALAAIGVGVAAVAGIAQAEGDAPFMRAFFGSAIALVAWAVILARFA